MNRQFSLIITALIVILIATIYFCYNFLDDGKKNLNQLEILSITITKPQSKSICDTIFQLTPQEMKDFVQKWNTASSLGYNKMSCTYYIDIKLSKGKDRSFGITQDKISEGWGGGIIYSINDKNYFDSLYSSFSKSTNGNFLLIYKPASLRN